MQLGPATERPHWPRQARSSGSRVFARKTYHPNVIALVIQQALQPYN